MVLHGFLLPRCVNRTYAANRLVARHNPKSSPTSGTPSPRLQGVSGAGLLDPLRDSMSSQPSFVASELPGGALRVTQQVPQQGAMSAPYEDSRVHYGVVRD